jgi:hypothetical protein
MLQSSKPSLEELLPILRDAGLKTRNDLIRVQHWDSKRRLQFFMGYIPELSKVDAFALCILFDITDIYE